jgi:hypothetical protein
MSLTSSLVNWPDHLTGKYISLEKCYKPVLTAHYEKYSLVKLTPALTVSKHSLRDLAYTFFHGVLKRVTARFIASYTKEEHRFLEDKSRWLLHVALTEEGYVTPNQARIFVDEILDTTVIQNSDFILNDLAINWFRITNSLVVRVNNYHANIVSQIEHLQTIFKKVVSTDGVKEEDFSLEAGYTKLEVIRYQAYIKAVRGKTQAIEDVQDALSKLITNWSVFYSKQQDTLNLLVHAFREEKVRARRDRIFKDCQEVVKNLFEKLEETNSNLDDLMQKFNALRSATIEIPYAVYVMFNDLKYIEQYITELAQNKRLLDEVKEAMAELTSHKVRYEEYFGKVEEYHKFREFFIDSVCYDFNRCSKMLANRILSEKGVN